MENLEYENAKEWVDRYFVKKHGNLSKISRRESQEVDESMGLMPLIAPYIDTAKKEIDSLRKELCSVKSIADQQTPTLFLEGKTDEEILKKAISVFAPGAERKINFKSGGTNQYGGANALASRSLAWLLEMKHRGEGHRVRAFAIFDGDKEGDKAKKHLQDNRKIHKVDLGTLLFKVEKFSAPTRLHSMCSKHFDIAIDLESYYHDKIWEKAENEGWLEKCDDPRTGLSDEMIKDFFNSKIDPREALEDEDLRRLKYNFTYEGKQKAASYIADISVEEAECVLKEFKIIVEKVVNHLLPDFQHDKLKGSE